MYFKRVLIVLALFLHTVVFAQWESSQKSVDLPPGFASMKDVVYVSEGEWNGRVDIYYPKNTSKPAPVIFNIHGGGWTRGSKESQTGFGSFFNAGFAVVNVAYRLAHEGKAPAAIEDVRCAMKYIVANARQFNIDPNRIVLMGTSAGAHLALMAGLLQQNTMFDKNCTTPDSFRVVAIVDKFGPTNLDVPGVEKHPSAANWLGSKVYDSKFRQYVSPVQYVKKTSPPTIIIHGTADFVVPYSQSEELHRKFIENGAVVKFITVEGGGHGGFSKEKSREISSEILDFLRKAGAY
jgi:acetyl esterase/lipase